MAFTVQRFERNQLSQLEFLISAVCAGTYGHPCFTSSTGCTHVFLLEEKADWKAVQS